MGTYTTNYNLFMPTIGEQGWGELVNGNFTTIDTAMKGFDDVLSKMTWDGDNVTFPGNVDANINAENVEIDTLTVPYNTDKYILAICKQTNYSQSYVGRDGVSSNIAITCTISDLFEYTTDFFKINANSTLVNVTVNLTGNRDSNAYIINSSIQVNGNTLYTVSNLGVYTLNNLALTDVVTISGSVVHNYYMGVATLNMSISTPIFGV